MELNSWCTLVSIGFRCLLAHITSFVIQQVCNILESKLHVDAQTCQNPFRIHNAKPS